MRQIFRVFDYDDMNPKSYSSKPRALVLRSTLFVESIPAPRHISESQHDYVCMLLHDFDLNYLLSHMM